MEPSLGANILWAVFIRGANIFCLFSLYANCIWDSTIDIIRIVFLYVYPYEILVDNAIISNLIVVGINV